MSADDLSKQLATALARIAALESAGAGQRTQAPQGIDPRAFIADPVGTMTRAGLPIDHVSRVLVAHALGDQAPAELRTYAAMGPQMSATHALASDVQAMRQRLEQYDARDRKESARQGFSALIADKTKYPLLAAAYGKNPALFTAALDSHQGDATAFAAAEEERLKSFAEAAGYTPPASSGNAETSTGQSTQAKQAQGGAVDTTPPPISQGKPGVFTQETHEQLKEKILRKYS